MCLLSLDIIDVLKFQFLKYKVHCLEYSETSDPTYLDSRFLVNHTMEITAILEYNIILNVLLYTVVDNTELKKKVLYAIIRLFMHSFRDTDFSDLWTTPGPRGSDN